MINWPKGAEISLFRAPKICRFVSIYLTHFDEISSPKSYIFGVFCGSDAVVGLQVSRVRCMRRPVGAVGWARHGRGRYRQSRAGKNPRARRGRGGCQDRFPAFCHARCEGASPGAGGGSGPVTGRSPGCAPATGACDPAGPFRAHPRRRGGPDHRLGRRHRRAPRGGDGDRTALLWLRGRRAAAARAARDRLARASRQRAVCRAGRRVQRHAGAAPSSASASGARHHAGRASPGAGPLRGPAVHRGGGAPLASATALAGLPHALGPDPGGALDDQRGAQRTRPRSRAPGRRCGGTLAP